MAGRRRQREQPDLSLERAAGGRVAGVDEAGRGPWAGPVVAAAVVLDVGDLPPRVRARITDSKLLTAEQRAALHPAILACADAAVGIASVAEIDSMNILHATMLAMRRAVARLAQVPDLVLVDGNRAPSLPCPVKTVVGGDRESLSIAAASIAAKVTRDRLMARLAADYPGYGWERNAGYGTAEHRAALARLGPCEHHRRSFRPIRELLEDQP
ncbi:MAG: ribonuclease HII [Rhodospirillaceae bacterium]|nr:ribonuclease HII [Rhodospirillaceae bacterium]